VIIYLFILYNLLFNLVLQVIYGRADWIFHIGESVLLNIFLNEFRLLQRICLTRGATIEVVLATAGALPNRSLMKIKRNKLVWPLIIRSVQDIYVIPRFIGTLC
jgi:hypothetical protein